MVLVLCDLKRSTLRPSLDLFDVGDRQRQGLCLSFPDFIAYEVKVNQRDIEGECHTPVPRRRDVSPLKKVVHP